MAEAGNMPWSIKGVSADARKIAKAAAMASGEAMGVWLSRLIEAASAVKLGQANQVALRPDPPVPAPAELRVDIEALSQRLATAERRIREQMEPLDRALAQIGRRLEALEAPALPPPEPRRRGAYTRY
jgi:hypothetical protein